MKNKIVIGLGLMLGLAAGVSSADSLGGSNGLEVNKDTPYEMTLANKLDMSGGRYYKITCQLNNVHNSDTLRAQVELANGSFSPVSINGQSADRVGAKRYEAPLTNGMNTLVLEHVLPGSIVKTKYSTPKYVPVTKDDQVCSRWMGVFASCKTVKKTEMVKVAAKDRQIVSTTYDDKLTFFAKDADASHKGTGTGYQIESCDATVELDTAPAADIADSAAPAPVADVPAPATDVAPVADVPAAPVADVPAPAADASAPAA